MQCLERLLCTPAVSLSVEERWQRVADRVTGSLRSAADRGPVQEVLSTIKSLPAVTNYDGSPVKSVQHMIIDCVNRTDVDVRRDMFGGVVLTGAPCSIHSAAQNC